jgi:hypothetical protein
MPHYRLMYPSEYLNAADLLGKDVVVTIKSVSIEEVPGVDGQKKPKPVVTFEGKHKRLPLPITCAKRIAQQLGNDTDDWAGKKVTLFPTTCQAFGATVECVRVR